MASSTSARARPGRWNDRARAFFAALGREPAIDYVPMPSSLRDSYQYSTQAEVAKLRGAGFTRPFFSLEDAVHHYVVAHLLPGRRLADGCSDRRPHLCATPG